MSNGLRRRRRLPVVPGIALCLLIFRALSGLNYAAVHIVLPNDLAEQPRVEVYSCAGPGKVAQRLDWVAEVPRLRLLPQPDGGIQELYVIAVAGSGSRYLDCEVLFGDGWIGPVQRRGVLTVEEGYGGTVQGIPRAGSGYELIRIVPQRLSQSAFIGPAVFNWQGDLWLLLVPVLQAIFLNSLWRHGLSCWRSLPLRLSGSSCVTVPPILEAARWPLQIFVLLLAGHQTVVVLERILAIRCGIQASLAVTTLTLLVVFLRVFLLKLQQTPAENVRAKGVFLLILFGLARVLWCMQIDSYQSTDYGRYARYGELIAAGRWGDLVAIRETLSHVYARRAIVTTVPAAWIFGPGARGIEVVNWLTQSAMAVAFWCYCCRLFGQRTGTAALLYLLLVPGFWYLGTIASHNVPTHLLLVLVFWCGDYLRCEWRLIEDGCGRGWCLWLLAAVFGLLGGFLELCRSYGIFFAVVGLCTVSIVFLRLVLRVWRRRWEKWSILLVPPALILTIASLVTCGCYVLVVRSVDRFITARLGEATNAISLLDSIAGVDSTDYTDGRAVDMYRLVYRIAAPVQNRIQLTCRKLIHEKLVMGRYLYGGVFKRNIVYSRQTDSMLQTFDRLQGLIRRFQSSRVPWFSLQQGVCDGVYLLLLIPACLRLLPLSGQVLHAGEFQPLVFTFFVGCAVFFVTEAEVYYGLVFVVPLCWNAGLVSGAGCQGKAEGARQWSDGAGLRLGATLACLCVIVHIAVGWVVDISNRCFCNIAFKEAGSERNGDLLFDKSRVHCAVALNSEHDSPSEVSKGSIEIALPSSPVKELRFLLTANHRVLNDDRRLSPSGLIVDFRLSRTPYTIYVNGRQWRSGVLADVKAPEFCVLSLSEFPALEPGKVYVEIELGPTAATDVVAGRRPEWLAIEFPHCL